MSALELEVTNVGGITDASFSFDSPVSIITGPNATNKTSLHQALAFALGADEVSIRSDATEAEVTLTIGDRSVMRTARRSGQGIQINGEAWVSDRDDRKLYEYFGCLLEFNPLRSAVRQNDDLEAVLKEPVDIDALERKRSAKLDEKRSLQREIEQKEDIDSEIRDAEKTIEEARAEKSELEAELERLQTKQAETSDSNEELEVLRQERTDYVLRVETLEQQVQDLEAAISRLESEREDVRESLSEKRAVVEEHDVAELKSERQSLYEEIEEISQRQETLQSVLTANRELLNSQYTGLLGEHNDLLDDTVDCWVCGDRSPVSEIEQNLDDLQSLIEQEKQKKAEYEPRIEEIEARIDEAKSVRRRVQELETKLDDIDQKLESRTDSLETKQETLADVREELAVLDDQIEAEASEQTDEITDLTDEIESVRVDIQNADQRIERADQRIETLEARRDERESKQERVDELSAEISAVTDRIERLEQHLREEFNDAMDDLVAELDFRRIERVWLDGEFDLVVARDIDGSVREDTPESFSESEREVVGLVLALAGYTAYNLDEIAPVLQLDTLGALDAPRVSRLLEYFSGTPDFLVAAVLPENASQMDHTAVKPVDQTQFAEPPS